MKRDEAVQAIKDMAARAWNCGTADEPVELTRGAGYDGTTRFDLCILSTFKSRHQERFVSTTPS